MDIRLVLLASGVLGVWYTYIGYPLFLIAAAVVLKRKVLKRYETPRVVLFVAAYNEGWVLKEKIENTLAQNYPADKLRIAVASDGSDDDTEEVVRRFTDDRVMLIAYPVRRGKMPVINETVPRLDADLIVFSDARQIYHPDAVRELAANFADPDVGAVSGELVLNAEKKEVVGKGIRLYWEYEKRLRKREGEIASCVGASGAIYAIRKKLFRKVPDVTILDDVAIPMAIIEQGYRVIFDREARAYDAVSTSSGQEYGRKARTLAGNFQIFFNLGRKYRFRNLFVLFEYFSHKVSRMLLPLFFALCFIPCIFIPGIPAKVFLGLQALFYLLALTGYLMERAGMKHHFLFHIPAVFCTIHFAIVTGFFRYARHRQSTRWKKMVRGTPKP